MLRYRCYAVRKAIAATTAFALVASMQASAAFAIDPDTASEPTFDQVPAAAGQTDVSAVSASEAVSDSSASQAQLPEIEMIPQTPGVAASMLAADVHGGDMVVQQDGLNFLIDADGATFTGWSAVVPTGSLSIPATVHVAGGEIPVVAMSFSQRDQQDESTSADRAATLAADDLATEPVTISAAAAWLAASDEVAQRLCAPEVTSVILPSSLASIDTTAFAAFPNAKTVVVDAANAVYKSHNGMLFNSDLSSLLLVPEGMEGNAVLPSGIATVPAFAFTRCNKFSAIFPFEDAGDPEGSSLSLSRGGMATSAFYAQDGLLYKKNVDASGAFDGTLTLVAAPPACGASVRLAAECTAIAEGALWGCRDLKTIQAPGLVSSICAGSAVSPDEIPSLLFWAPVSGVAAESTDAAVPPPDAVSLLGEAAMPYLYTYDAEADSASGMDASTASADASIVYAQVPSFRPSVVLSATVATVNDAQHTQTWKDAGFANFIEAASLPESSTEAANEEGTTIPKTPIGPADENGFVFKMLSNGTLSVAWGSKDDAPADVEIPASGVLDGISYTVTKIADEAFVNDPQIESVKLPLTITEIGDAAFARCHSLRTVALNSGLTYIGADAFRTSGLEGIVIPSGVHYIGAKAFGDLKDTDIVAPTAIPYVDEAVLSGSSGVHVYVPYNEAGEYTWNTGVVATDNRLCPYGVRLNSQVSDLQPGQSVDLFGEDGYIYAPGNVKVSCAYNADTVSIDAETGTISAIQNGNTDVNVSLSVPVSEVSISRQKHVSAKVG